MFIMLGIIMFALGFMWSYRNTNQDDEVDQKGDTYNKEDKE